LLKFSEAVSLALHTAVVLAQNPDKPLTAREIASGLGVSEAHLSKVLQRLVKFGLVHSFRGPGGGFVLAVPADHVTLLQIYQAIEGPLQAHHCLLGKPACNGHGCVLGGLLASVHSQVEGYLSQTTLARLIPLEWRREQDA
jgi:Rrf2 family protein